MFDYIIFLIFRFVKGFLKNFSKKFGGKISRRMNVMK